MSQALAQFADAILEEVTELEQQDRIYARLCEITAELQEVAAKGAQRVTVNVAWDKCGMLPEQWANVSLRLRAAFARRFNRRERSPATLLEWGRHYLSRHFRRQPSGMHVWLAEQLDAMTHQRGTRLNLIGPRGAAKSTIGTLAYTLRAALEAWEPYVWIISDTRQQAQGHLDNIKQELIGNELLATDYPQAAGKGTIWRAAPFDCATACRSKRSARDSSFAAGSGARTGRR